MYREKSRTIPPPSDSPARPGSGAAGVERQFLFGGVLQARRHVGGRTRPDHGQRLDLIDAGVAGIELEEQIVATHVAAHQSAKIVLDAFSDLVHREEIAQFTIGFRPAARSRLYSSLSLRTARVLRHAHPLLTMTLVGFQWKPSYRSTRHVRDTRSAMVTHQSLRHEHVQHDID